MSERFGRVAVAVIVAVMTTIGSLFLFTAGTRDRFEPLDTAETAAPQSPAQTSLLQPGVPPEATDETVVEESEAPAPEPVAETTRLRHAVPIADFLTRAGLNLFEAERWAGAFRSAAHGRYLSRGHIVSLERDPQSGQLRGFRYEIDERSEIVEKTFGSGVIIASQQAIRYRVETTTAAFPIRSSLETDAVRRLPRPIVDKLVEAFGSRPRTDQQRATGLKVVYQEYVSLDGSHRFLGDVQAAELDTRTKAMLAFAFRDSYGRSHLYDQQGKPLGPRILRYPLPFEYVSSGFSRARYHPILHYYRQHVGVDLVARYGTPVKAIADGRVDFANWGGELGRCIRLDHDRGWISIYGHLSKISAAVTEGSYVSVGQVIGWVGTSGLSTGPHLHFGLMKDGNYVNPMTVRLDSRGSEISPRMREVFAEIQQEDEKVLSELPQNGGVVRAKAVAKPPMDSRPAAGAPSVVPVTHASSTKLHVEDNASKSEGQGIAGGL